MINKKLNAKELIFCGLFAALISVGAFLKIPVPFVPFTLQFLFTNLAALLLGKRLGSISVMIYIIIGLVGVPVFANGGGLSYIFQPSFGYVLGILAGTFVTGAISEKQKILSTKVVLLASFAGLSVIYLCGLVYFYLMANYYLQSPIAASTLLVHGFLVTLPGDFVKIFASLFIVRRLKHRLVS